ncbi:multidrug effflux MFS transporter [Streptomyces olivaceiscleroticus]|uniref:Multidrug effflux MFS transporter n=1 Tax=Streptomyces olivaceiscleroticus TaxID=68245 RepID=A0ABP3JUZ3_9ACTN
MVSPPHTSSESPHATDAGAVAATAQAPDTAGRPRKRTGALIAVLGALTGIAPLATDMYVPGFPAMGETLHASSSAVQLTMTAFLAGLVVGQVLVGPISDGLGRRGLLIWGGIGFTVLSLACAVAPNVEVLTTARFLQGVCGAAGMVLARAVLTDRFHGPDIPRYFALLSQILGVAPVAAPVVGGAILSVSTWRAVFVVLAFIGALLLLSVVAKVPESLPPERRHSGGIGGTFRAMGTLLGNRAFMGYVLVLGFSAAALFAYISGSSFVFENLYGVSATVYSLIFACNAIAMLIAGAVFGKLARHHVPLNTLLTAGVCIAGLGALVQVLLLATIGSTLAGTWICLFLTLGGIGVTFPATMSLGQTLGRATPGAASALLGGLQFLFGAAASPLVGAFGEGSSAPMALIMLIALVAAALCLLTLVRPWQHHGETEN